ncbi:MAG: PAS domain-containing protein [Deltaproteobacteria bacterium]|nr:PAS domain-containing protein [Deltaproteobacteria bacterium]
MRNDTLIRIIDTLPNSVMVINADFVVIAANKAAREWTKVDTLGFDTLKCHKVLYNSNKPCDSSKRRCPIKEVISTETPVTLTHNLCMDGSIVHEIHVAPFREEPGQTAQFIISCHDITEFMGTEKERKKLDAWLRQQQKLEAIDTLSGGVAHEINNPIHGIMNYARLISERLDPENPLREFSDGIGHETERVAKIVRNLLAFTRQEKESHSPAKISNALDETLSLIRTIIQQDQITLQVDLPDDLPEINCRIQQIQQVLINLLINARDALNKRYPAYDPDKIISVTARCFEKDGRLWIRILVEDHGSGIPDEVRDRLSDPCFSIKYGTEGAGVGLSISHGIVKEHHGELSVKCEAGQYTCFQVDLPVDNSWSLDRIPEECRGAG